VSSKHYNIHLPAKVIFLAIWLAKASISIQFETFALTFWFTVKLWLGITCQLFCGTISSGHLSHTIYGLQALTGHQVARQGMLLHPAQALALAAATANHFCLNCSAKDISSATFQAKKSENWFCNSIFVSTNVFSFAISKSNAICFSSFIACSFSISVSFS
jgi:hypothetical protein